MITEEHKIKTISPEYSNTETVINNGTAAVVTEPPTVYQKKKSIFRFYQIVWYIVSVIETLLLLRVVLRALGADPTSGFASLIYTLSFPFAAPFFGVLRTSDTGVAVFEWSTIFAAVVYFLAAYGITQLSQFIKPVTPTEISQTIDET